AVNACGDIRDPRTGRILAGARAPGGAGFADPVRMLREGRLASPFPVRAGGWVGTSTTLGVVATHAPLPHTELAKVAPMAPDGLARTIPPVHTPLDGDTVFAVSLPEPAEGRPLPADGGRVGVLAAEMLADAVLRGVGLAQGVPGAPAASEWPGP